MTRKHTLDAHDAHASLGHDIVYILRCVSEFAISEQQQMVQAATGLSPTDPNGAKASTFLVAHVHNMFEAHVFSLPGFVWLVLFHNFIESEYGWFVYCVGRISLYLFGHSGIPALALFSFVPTLDCRDWKRISLPI